MIDKLTKPKFYLFLIIIAILGLIFRFIDYDRVPPFDVTKDEFFYPWAGMSLIQTGVPKAWSLFDSYKEGEIVYMWGTWYRIVSPWVEKPPLYSLLAGSWVLINGAKDLFDVRLSVLRILPIMISFFTIIIIGILAKNLFGKSVGLISAILYASIPTIVMSNRLSLVENLLTPLALLTLYLLVCHEVETWQKFKKYIIGFLIGLIVLTKNIGVAFALPALGLFAAQKRWRELMVIGVISFIFTAIHPLIGLYYDWSLFVNVLNDYRQALAFAGLPEITSTIFRNPIIGHQWDRAFLDGSMLAGYILLFSSPFWLKSKDFINKNKYTLILFLGFPFSYIIILDLLESGGTLYSFFGWHVYPLFPFLVILNAKAMNDLWQKPDLVKTLFFYLVIGFSTVRFFLLISPEIQKSWQWILGIFLLILIGGFATGTKYQRIILTTYFIIFLFINLLVIINLNQIYPGFAQPL